MITKDQERKALEQIKKIVDSLGDDSYIGTAFEGCFEIAAKNIENDFACSMKERAEIAERRKRELEIKLVEKDQEITELEAKLMAQDQELEGLNAKSELLTNENKRIQSELDKADDDYIALEDKYNAEHKSYEDQIALMKEEITKLKVKLYDLTATEYTIHVRRFGRAKVKAHSYEEAARIVDSLPSECVEWQNFHETVDEYEELCVFSDDEAEEENYK